MYSLPPEISIVKHNQLEILEINHPVVKAKVALQGAQLLSWQPVHCDRNLLWLSDVEPFETGVAIRGGVPICYPWFGGVKQPPHGTARISVWELKQAEVLHDKVLLTLTLNNEAKFEIELGESCQLAFTHLAEEQAQVALHTYFKVGEVSQIELYNLPTSCFDSLTQSQQTVSSPRKIATLVDEIYTAEKSPTEILDPVMQRRIFVEHQNASEIVVWNPWHKAMSGMNETGHKTMICVETARVSQLLSQGETVGVKFTVHPL